MIKLEIGNSYSRITGLSAVQEKQLRETLSYIVGGSSAFFSGFRSKKRSLLDKKGNFPTGLMHRLPKWPMEIKDVRIRPPVKFTGTNTGNNYKWQIDAVTECVMNKRGIVSAPTGTGKSRAMKLLVQALSMKTLIIVPSLEIKKQLLEVFSDVPLVTIENIDATLLKTMVHYDCLIVDEAHRSAAKTYQKLNRTAWGDIYYRFFFTATPFRNDDEETLLFEAIAGQVIYKLDYQTAIKENYIVPVESYYLEAPKQDTNAYTYAQVYSELVVNNTPRNVIIANLLTNLHSSGKSTLCLVREVEHGRILSELTGLPFVSGADDESRKYIRQFNNNNIKVLIGTTGILGEGVDSRPAEYIIIAGLGKAKSQFMQQVGRGVRRYEGKDSAKVIIFRDSSHKFLLRHFGSQKKVLLDEYGVKALKLKI